MLLALPVDIATLVGDRLGFANSMPWCCSELSVLQLVLPLHQEVAGFRFEESLLTKRLDQFALTTWAIHGHLSPDAEWIPAQVPVVESPRRMDNATIHGLRVNRPLQRLIAVRAIGDVPA